MSGAKGANLSYFVTGTGQGDLADPMGGDAADYEACWRDVRAAVTRLVENAV